MKRQRCEEWWTLLCDEISLHGGFVHSNLEFFNDGGNRDLIVNKKVNKEEILLKIPTANFMTKQRAFLMYPWLKYIIEVHVDDGRPPLNCKNGVRKGGGSIYKNSTADLAIAVGMACQSTDNLLYLHSLPESSCFDALPRRWDDIEIQDLLAGTTLLETVKATKRGVFEDYNMMLQQHQNFTEKMKKTTTDENVNDNNDKKSSGTITTNMTASFPSFEKFSDMLAAVTSRAFQIDDSDDDVALVPILDLGNHTRGKTTTKFGRKNVSYRYHKTEEFMLVKSTIDIDADECIRLTYGAKSNDQLLLNYGFCIPRNIEPDGSSNDVLKFLIFSDRTNSPGGDKIIALRAGPKSYSYGGFAATLEKFLNETDNNTGMQDNNEDVDHSDVSHEEEDDGKPDDIDFEDFLNQCDYDNEDEDETGDSDDFIDLYDAKTDERMDDSELANSNPSIKKEIEALKMFKQNLIKMSECYKSYKGTDIQTLLLVKPGYTITRMYSTILSLSELRTIYFFVRAIDKVQLALNPNANYPACIMDIITDQEDLDMIEKQTNDLSNAYMAIRHGV